MAGRIKKPSNIECIVAAMEQQHGISALLNRRLTNALDHSEINDAWAKKIKNQ
jgi:hypothetical protein